MSLSISRNVAGSVLLVLSAMFVACGGNVVFVEEGEGGGVTTGPTTSSGQGPCGDVAFDFDVPAQICTGENTCSIHGSLPDGRDARIECSIGKDAACFLTIDDVQSCSCPMDLLDWANVCPNGVPTCAGWQVNYVNAEYCLAN